MAVSCAGNSTTSLDVPLGVDGDSHLGDFIASDVPDPSQQAVTTELESTVANALGKPTSEEQRRRAWPGAARVGRGRGAFELEQHPLSHDNAGALSPPRAALSCLRVTARPLPRTVARPSSYRAALSCPGVTARPQSRTASSRKA